jgi:hypothetical protein
MMISRPDEALNALASAEGPTAGCGDGLGRDVVQPDPLDPPELADQFTNNREFQGSTDHLKFSKMVHRPDSGNYQNQK